MRKGNEKRQALLDAAERLFLQKGYEGTSVQDILDALQLSRGGFYHHFDSKEEVLRALCARRAERASSWAEAELNAAASPMARINAVLHAFVPLRKEEAAFLTMLLPVISTTEGRAIAMCYQDALCDAFLPMLRAEVASAAAVGVVCPPVREMEAVILHLVNHCWMEAAKVICTAMQDGVSMDQLSMLNLLEKYRRAIEVLLEAPYGSIEIIRVEEAAAFFDK